MDDLVKWLPALSFVLSLSFAVIVFRRYLERKGPHLLIWSIGLVFYGIGGFCEAFHGLTGWNPLIFRLWYLFGAILVAAWLGQGTVYLLATRSLGKRDHGTAGVEFDLWAGTRLWSRVGPQPDDNQRAHR